MMKWLYWMSPVLFLATPAWALSWSSTEDGTSNGCELEQPNPTRQRNCWLNFTGTGTGDSNLLKINQCENSSIKMVPDFDGAATACKVKVYICLGEAANTSMCFLLENKMLTSSLPAIYGFDGRFMYVDIDVAAGAGNNCRVEFQCNQ